MTSGQVSKPAEAVGGLLTLFARAARARSLYGTPDHDFVVKQTQGLKTKFEEVLSAVGEVSLRVRPEAFVLGDEVVLSEPDPEDSIPFAFFRDGVRRIDLQPGLELDEMEVLLTAATKGATHLGLGEDIVSLLWAHELRHVQYAAVDTLIVEGEASGSEALEAEVDELLTAIYGAERDPEDWTRSVTVDQTDVPAKSIAQSLDAVDEMAPGFHPPRVMPRPAYAKAFVEEAAEDAEALEVRLLCCALEAMSRGLEGADAQIVLDSVTALFEGALTRGDLEWAGRVVSSMRAVGGQWQTRWLEGAASETRLLPTIQTALEGGQAPHALLSLLKACGGSGVPAILAAMPGVSDSALRRTLGELALEVGATVPQLEALLADERAFVAGEALYLLGRSRSADARKAALRAVEHSQAPVRAALLETSGLLEGEELLSVASILVVDPDPKVQAAAARALGASRDSRAFEPLRLAAEAPELLGAPMQTKEAVMANFAVIGKSGALSLLVKSIKAGHGALAKKSAEELAVAAVKALQVVGTASAHKALEKETSARNKRVREVAREVRDRMAGGGA